MPDLGPFDPPRPAWVRVPAAGRERADREIAGWVHQWKRGSEWGLPVWEARVSTVEREPYWTTSGNVRPRI